MKKLLLVMGLIFGVVSTQALANPPGDPDVPRYWCNGEPVPSPFFCDER